MVGSGSARSSSKSGCKMHWMRTSFPSVCNPLAVLGSYLHIGMFAEEVSMYTYGKRPSRQSIVDTEIKEQEMQGGEL